MSKYAAIRYAFMKSLPVLFGYLFLGAAFGIMIVGAGYNALWAFFTSLFVYAGSGQFLLVELLSASASLPMVFLMSFLINSRHIFYGLSFVEKFRSFGVRKPYMIFSMTDETYSVLCSTEYPPHIDEVKCAFYISLFDHMYWIAGGVLGALLGQLIPFDFKGIEFSMTALFVVIVIEQWRSSKKHLPALIGAISAVLCLVLIGADNFILPSLALTAAALMSLRKVLDKEDER